MAKKDLSGGEKDKSVNVSIPPSASQPSSSEQWVQVSQQMEINNSLPLFENSITISKWHDGGRNTNSVEYVFSFQSIQGGKMQRRRYFCCEEDMGTVSYNSSRSLQRMQTGIFIWHLPTRARYSSVDTWRRPSTTLICRGVSMGALSILFLRALVLGFFALYAQC